MEMSSSFLFSHFSVAVTRTQSRNKPARPIGGNGNRWLNKNQTQQKQDVHKFTFTANFWCLNPAVAFDDIKDEIHSIVLTSGTLSPMTSFSSELDVKFPQQLEANHVIDKKQVWISTLSHGPNRQNLNATYRNTETYAFQDEIGRLTLSVCRTIAHGVLLFLPSYAMLNKLTERWRQTGLYNDLNSKKVVIPEPRFSDEFESSIKHFYDVISATEKGANDSGVDGALFIAVCRGKVSEGLDFADNNARAVICVGIPYPNVRDVQVDLKKKYNDKRKIDNRNILSGNEWYEIQAFRALNQALGRCIRHKRDWGAILMVDDRYQKSPKYIASLSKWVRAGIVHYSSCDMMTESLKQFSEDMVQMDADHKAQIQEKEIEEDLKNESEPRKDPTRMAIERLERIRNEAKAAAPIFGVGRGKKVIEETERKEEEAMKSLLEDERKRNRPTQMLSHFARSMTAVDNLPPLGSFGDRIPITKPKEAPQVKQAEMNTKERGQKGVIESISSALPVSLKPSTLGNVNLNSGISGSVTMPVQSFENAPSSSSRVNKPGSILSHFKRGNQASETKVINLEDEEDADDPKEMSGSSEKENGDIPAASVPLSTVVPDSSSDDDLTEDGQIIGKGKVGGRQPDADVSEEEDLDELGQRVVGKTSPGFSFKPILASSSSIAHEDKSTPGCDGEEHLPSSSSGYTPALSQRAKLNLARKNGKKKGLVVLKKAKPPVTYIGDSDDDFI